MEFEIQYQNSDERINIINANSDKYLIAEKNIKEGNFLVFSTSQPLSVEVADLKQENKLLKAQNNATSLRADFIEDVVAEMATQVYQ